MYNIDDQGLNYTYYNVYQYTFYVCAFALYSYLLQNVAWICKLQNPIHGSSSYISIWLCFMARRKYSKNTNSIVFPSNSWRIVDKLNLEAKDESNMLCKDKE